MSVPVDAPHATTVVRIVTIGDILLFANIGPKLFLGRFVTGTSDGTFLQG